jgi:hypothetical protein
MTAGTAADMIALPEVAWHISTRSANGGGNCVEAGPILDGSGRVAVRHSRHPEGHVLVYTSAGWTAFLAGIRAAGFNRP